MKFQWSLVLIAISFLIVGAASLKYLKTQIPASQTELHSYQAISPTPSAVAASGRIEPAGKVIHIAVPSLSEHSRLENLLVEQGEQVKKGQVIAMLDSYAEHQANCKQAERQLQLAQAELKKTNAAPKSNDLAAQQFMVLKAEERLANAEKEQSRYRRLFAEGAVSLSVLDDRNLAAELSKGDLEQAKATLASISEVRPVESELASAQVDNARAALEVARARLQTDFVRAPSGGLVLKINTNAGEAVGTNGVVDLANTESMCVIAEVYESDAGLLKLGQSATIQCDALPTKIHGVIQKIGLMVEKKKTIESDAAADSDSRIVETRIALNALDCKRLARYTNSRVKVTIKMEPEKHA